MNKLICEFEVSNQDDGELAKMLTFYTSDVNQ